MSEYFNQDSGVYFESEKNEIWIFKEVEPISLINKKTFKIDKIKRYDIQNFNYKMNKIAVVKNENLVFMGVL